VNTAPRVPSRFWSRLLALASLLFIANTGCVVGTVYAVKAYAASTRLEEAKTLGAEKTAAYEYYYAQSYMEKASEEASEANYGDAIDYADTAEEYAEKAIELARAAQKGAGR